MSIQEILAGGGGLLVAAMTLIQIAPVKVNPWSWLARCVGKAVNGDVLKKLDVLETRLDGHIATDEERNADMHRARILQFNTELLRGNRHTEEDFNEIFYNIDCYERYCREHPEYQNNRAVHAIMNIKRVYDKCLAENDFL